MQSPNPDSPFADHTPRMIFGLVVPENADEPWRMQDGPWMRRRDGSFSAAALGAFLDHAFTGSSIHAGKPEGMNSFSVVTTELAFELVPGVDPEGELRSTSTMLGASSGAALGQGTVTDSAGRLIAVGTAAVQFLPRSEEERKVPYFKRPWLDPVPSPVEDILGLTIEKTSTGAVGRTVAGRWLANSRTALHGGVVTAMLEHTAHEAVGGAPWQTTSLRVAFLRPGPVGEPLAVESTIEHQGRSLAAVTSRLVRGDGKAAAIATSMYRKFDAL